MASGGHDPDLEEDLAGQDALPKKKRFTGAFKKMKRFFTSRMRSKSREDEGEGSVGMKAKSTPDVLNAPTDDDTEDEGGFVTNKAMSMSADSVFTPDPRPGSSIEGLKETTRSMEVLPQGFTHELFRKIKRRGRNDTDDEGFPNSPVSPSSASGDVIGGKLKKSSKSGSKDSNLSMASSETDPDEEIFGPKWTHGMPLQQKNRDQKGGKGDVDLDLITSSSSLDSSMLKDKIAVGRKNRRPISRVRQPPSPSAKRSPTPLTQVEETNENEDEVQVTIEAPPAQTTPEPVEKTPLLEYSDDDEPKSVIRPPRTPSPVMQSPAVVVLPKTEEPKQTLAVEKPKEIEIKKEEKTKSNSLPRAGSRQAEPVKKTNSSQSSEDEKSDYEQPKGKAEVIEKEEKEKPKRVETPTSIERVDSKKETSPKLQKEESKRDSTPIGVKRSSFKKEEPKKLEALNIERTDSKKEERIKPPVSPKIKTKHDLPVSPMKEEPQKTETKTSPKTEAKTSDVKKEQASESPKPKHEAKEGKESSFPVVLRRTGKLTEIQEKGTLRKHMDTATKRQTIAGDSPFSLFADLKEDSSTQSKDDMTTGGEVDRSEFAQMFNKLRKQASIKKSIDEVENRRTSGGSSTVRRSLDKKSEVDVDSPPSDREQEVTIGSPPSDKKMEIPVGSPPKNKKPNVVAGSPSKEKKVVIVTSPSKERKSNSTVESPLNDVSKKPEPTSAAEPPKKAEIIVAKSDKKPVIEKKPEVLSPKPTFANVSLKSPTKPEESKPLASSASLKSPASTNEEQKTVTAKPQLKAEEKKTIVITKETEKEPAPAKSSTDKPSALPNKMTVAEPTSPTPSTGGGSEPAWFALARRKTSGWGDKDTEDKEKKDNNNMAVKKEQEETKKTEKPEPTTLIIEKKTETAKQETNEESSGKPLLRSGSKCGSSADRSSKVYDLIKNFQNNQVT